MGQENVNNLLTTMNIKPISNNMWTLRMKECGNAFKNVCDRSVKDAVDKELTQANEGGIK